MKTYQGRFGASLSSPSPAITLQCQARSLVSSFIQGLIIEANLGLLRGVNEIKLLSTGPWT